MTLREIVTTVAAEGGTNMRAFGPKPKDDFSIGKLCPACSALFKEGDYTTLIALGPGDDPEAQKLARECRSYNAVVVEVHYKCATGRDYNGL